MIGPQDGLAAARSAADLVSTLALLSPGTVRAVLSRAEVEAAAGSYLRVALEGLEKDAAEGLGKDAAEGLGSAVSGGAAGGADADADAEGPGKAAAAAAAAARARRGAGALRDVAAAWGALTALHDCLHPTPMTCDDPSWAAHPPQPTPAAPAVVTRLYTAFAAGAAAAGASLRAAAGTAAWGAVLTLSLEGASSLLHAALRACCRRFQPIPVPSTRRVTRCPRLIHTPHTHPSPIHPIHTLTHTPHQYPIPSPIHPRPYTPPSPIHPTLIFTHTPHPHPHPHHPRSPGPAAAAPAALVPGARAAPRRGKAGASMSEEEATAAAAAAVAAAQATATARARVVRERGLEADAADGALRDTLEVPSPSTGTVPSPSTGHFLSSSIVSEPSYAPFFVCPAWTPPISSALPGCAPF